MAHKGLAGPCLFRRDLSFADVGRPWRLPLYWRFSSSPRFWGGVTWFRNGTYVSHEAQVDNTSGDLVWEFPINNSTLPDCVWRMSLFFNSNIAERAAYFEYKSAGVLKWHTNMVFPQSTNGRLGGTVDVISDSPPILSPFRQILTPSYGLWADDPGTFVPG